ncbi:MAG: hypothetical protein IKI30_08365 [Oxalobacter sp.]|nr:hypothetical protein [Oxalobacter sp.]
MKKTLLASAIIFGVISVMGCNRYTPPTTWTKIEFNDSNSTLWGSQDIYMKYIPNDKVKGILVSVGIKPKSNVIETEIKPFESYIVKCENREIYNTDGNLLETEKRFNRQIEEKQKEIEKFINEECNGKREECHKVVSFYGENLSSYEESIKEIINTYKKHINYENSILKFACNIEPNKISDIPQQSAQNKTSSNAQQQNQPPNAAEQIQAPTNSNAQSASGTSNDWVHVNSRQGNYGNTNHAYVLPSTLSNNKIQVKEVIEGGQRNGNHYTYWMEANCSDGMIRMASNVQHFDANNNFKGENPPSSPGWYKATGQKDPAVWHYICQR